ncbi:lysophospholipid acyltransferase family protein [Niabella hirudinis]|uniref:lysophospholipid acyltransferase family protein n=1 Tax=Niabella hirudinis TaxID=1285929 RepID=UPI003EBC4C19
MYYIVYGFLYLCSLLPLPVLYLLSDFFYTVVYYLIGYRKKVVMQNLAIAFPEKTLSERERIAKNFYHKFIDSFVETVKLLSAPDSFFEKRFTGNWELVDQYYEQGRSVQLHLGHNFNWEWGNVVLAKRVRYQVLGVYMPISSKPLDRIFRKLRSRSGTVMLDAHHMARAFLPFADKQYCLGLVADQSPGKVHKAKWFNFFNKKTAFTIGPAKNAIRNDTVVIFAFIARPKRGHYKVTFSVATEQPQHTTENELTSTFVRYLQNVITSNPDMWLWSHRRWKHEWKEGDVMGD